MSYNPSEPRDEQGRWTSGGATNPPKKPYAATMVQWANHAVAYSRYQASLAIERESSTDGSSPPVEGVAAKQKVQTVAEKKQAWIDAHYREAKEIADKYGVTPEEILGIAALESNWGEHPFASKGNNYFGMHAPVHGQSGTMRIGRKPGNMATFHNFKESAEAFMKQNGSLVSGVKDPEEFARRLQNSGKFGIDPDYGTKVPGYVRSVANTISGLRRFKPH